MIKAAEGVIAEDRGHSVMEDRWRRRGQIQKSE